jgi:hypothetical protein
VILDGYDEIISPANPYNDLANNQANVLLGLLASANCRFLLLMLGLFRKHPLAFRAPASENRHQHFLGSGLCATCAHQPHRSF